MLKIISANLIGQFYVNQVCASLVCTYRSKLKLRILFSMLQYSPEKLSKLWHGNSCFAFQKMFSGFIFFLILFSCSTQLFKNQLKQTQDAQILFAFFCYLQAACNCSNLSKQEVKHSYYNLSIKRENTQKIYLNSNVVK